MLSRARPAATAALALCRQTRPSVFTPVAVRLAFVTRSFSATPSEAKAAAENEAPKTEQKKQSSEVVKMDYDDYDDNYEPHTAKEKVSYYGTIFLRLAMLAAGVACIGFTAKELFPGRMSPQSIFSEVFDHIRYKEEIQEMVGDNGKAFGRDTGRNTEGRRNHVDSYKYKGEDGSDRVRVRFNIKGDKGQILVWAEVSDKMSANEYVYIIVQSTRTGRVYTVVDNRDQLAAGMLHAGKEGDQDISKFFFGGK